MQLADMRVVVSRDGAIACLVEPGQVVVTSLPTLARISEIGIADDTDVTVVGEYVAVLARAGTLHVVDPDAADGPEKVGELELDPGSRILASSGDYLLVALAAGVGFVLIARQPVLWRLPTRTAVVAAGAAATDDHFILLVAGVLEEWSAVSRAPLRRFRIDRPIAAHHVGGAARHVWFVPDAEPDFIVAVPLAGAGRPIRIELSEPAARVAADPSGVSLAIVGARTGAVSLLTLGERTATTIHGGRVGDIAWRGSTSLLCTTESMLELVEVGRAGNGQRDELEEVVTRGDRPLTTQERLSAWKDWVVRKEPGEQPEIEAVTPGQTYDQETVSLHEWRDAVASWTRRVLAGARGEPPLLAAGPLYDVGGRLGIAPEDAPFLWLAYGARLCGLDGVAPVDLAAVVPRRWDEALGRGRLAATGAFSWRRTRVHLVPEIAAALDELAPLCGTSIASAVVAERSVAVIAPPTVELAALARWAAPQLGPLLVPNARGLRNPQRFVLEARVRGLVPLVPWQRLNQLPDLPSAIVLDDASLVDTLQLSVALTYPR